MNANLHVTNFGLLPLLAFFVLVIISGAALANESDTQSNPFVNFLRGQISAPVKATLAASMTGKVTLFDVQEGSAVRASSKLIEFDCSLPKAHHTLLSAEKSAAEKKYQVSQRLHEFNNISELEVALAEADRDIALARLTESELALSRCTIKAPFDGFVVAKHAYQHEYVNEGDALLELVSQSDLEIEMLVPASHFNDYQRGTAVTMILDDSKRLIRANITRIVPVIDPVSQMVKVFAALHEPIKDLIPGMTGNIRLQSE